MNIKKTLALKLAKQYLTEDDLATLLIESVEDVTQTKEEEEILFEDLRGIEGLHTYLARVMLNDKNRYFAAGSPMEQVLTKGAYNRTMYLKSKLNKKIVKPEKLASPRTA